LDAGVRITGCTVHVVRPEMDAGPIIAQAAVAVLPDDTPDTLAARVLAAEHKLYPLALAMFASGQATVAGEKIEYLSSVNQQCVLYSPSLDEIQLSTVTK
jgi:phosphoribosylglycinamide formyltransferase-1